MLPAFGGKHNSEKRLRILSIKHLTFLTPKRHKRSRLCHYCSLLLLCCSFGSLCVRFLPPSETACGSTPVLFSPPSPVCKNDSMHSTCNFVNFVCNLLFSLCFSCFTHPFLPIRCHLFLKNSFPPSLGSMILKTALRQNHARKSFPGPPFARITPIFRLFIALGICKIVGKSVYFLFMHPLWRLCLPFCVLPHVFCTTFSHFRNAFVIILLKNGPCSRKSHRTNM